MARCHWGVQNNHTQINVITDDWQNQLTSMTGDLKVKGTFISRHKYKWLKSKRLPLRDCHIVAFELFTESVHNTVKSDRVIIPNESGRILLPFEV